MGYQFSSIPNRVGLGVKLLIVLSVLSGFAVAQNAEFTAVDGAEAHLTYQLKPGAHVRAFSISGPVTVETTGGSTAEVHIYRKAANSADLIYRQIFIEQTPTGLLIHQKSENNSVDLLNRVVLKLPREVRVTAESISGDFTVSGVIGDVNARSVSGSVDARQIKGDLTVSSVSGNVTASDVDGTVDVNSVSGNVDIKQVKTISRVNSVSGNVRLAIARVNQEGLRVNSVSRNVYLILASDINTELGFTSISTNVSNKIAGLDLRRDEHSNNYSGRIGSGGPKITVNSVSGTVVLQSL